MRDVKELPHVHAYTPFINGSVFGTIVVIYIFMMKIADSLPEP